MVGDRGDHVEVARGVQEAHRSGMTILRKQGKGCSLIDIVDMLLRLCSSMKRLAMESEVLD